MQKPSVHILASQMRKIFQKSEIFYRESLLGVLTLPTAKAGGFLFLPPLH